MKLILAVSLIKLTHVAWVLSEMHSLNFEHMNQFGLGRRIFPRIKASNVKFLPLFDTAQHPSPLPTPKRNLFSGTNYNHLDQGVRRKSDKRVYFKQFDYPSRSEGQQFFFRGDHNCILTRLSVQASEGMATLLRGGVGYRYFLALVRVPSHARAKGRVRAWCRNFTDEYAGAW